MPLTAKILLKDHTKIDLTKLPEKLNQSGWQVGYKSPLPQQTERVLSLQGQLISICNVPTPVPEMELTPLLDKARYFDGLRETAKTHERQLQINVMSVHIDRSTLKEQATALLGLITHMTDSSTDPDFTLIWNDLFIRPKEFFSGSLSPHQASSQLSSMTIDTVFLTEPNTGKICTQTNGLKDYIGHELLLPSNLNYNAAEMSSFCAFYAGYLIDNGPIIRELNTVDGPDGSPLIAHFDHQSRNSVLKFQKPQIAMETKQPLKSSKAPSLSTSRNHLTLKNTLTIKKFLTFVIFLFLGFLGTQTVSNLYAEEPPSYQSSFYTQKAFELYYGTEHDPLNHPLSLEYAQKGAELGDTNAQYLLGKLYQKGLNIRHSTEQAIYWYEKSAQNNHPQAMFELASIYLNAPESTQKPTAYTLLKKAAFLGNPNAQEALTLKYLNTKDAPTASTPINTP